MFKDNTIKGVKSYFHNKLIGSFSGREIDIFFEWACAELFQLSRADLLLNERRFSESELLSFRSVIKELITGKPIQYIFQKAYFLGEEFKVTPAVLIPRPETEELVEKIVMDHPDGGMLLDIGTGSGVIPISIKKKNPKFVVSAIDISAAALEVAIENARMHKVAVQYEVRNILENGLEERYDVIVSNPPYVLESDKLDMTESVLSFEPHLALFVPDEDPLLFYVRIAELAKLSLHPNGYLYFEIHERFAAQVVQMLDEQGFQEVVVLKDLQGKDRIISAKKSPAN